MLVEEVDFRTEKLETFNHLDVVEVGQNVQQQLYLLNLEVEDDFLDVEVDEDCVQGNLGSFFVKENEVEVLLLQGNQVEAEAFVSLELVLEDLDDLVHLSRVFELQTHGLVVKLEVP